MTRDRLIRAGLAVLAVSQGILAVWALVAPRSFYDDFPGGGHSWVSANGPYNQHLVTDVGALSLALVAVIVWAAWRLQPQLVGLAAVAWLCWSVPHLIFHLGHRGMLSSGDQAASNIGQALTVAIALALLATLRRPS